ncbi:MAG: enoyl-CoA hydratase-related protein [Sandarakinorhabdus sp.]|jgi:crotonobetainyl-CoA hydratase|nr:enoyl-CoA hydratase-related protein [Sandarakinorhabdus sp.]
MAFEHVTVATEGRVLVVTINRPERMNALHPPANAELDAVFNDFAANPDLWVAIITGAGDRAFSAGNDLRWQAEGNAITVPPSGFGGLTSRWDLDKPVIAAVNGVAMGGGFEVALAADIIIASETASFALPEPKVGLAALAGGLHRLPRAIGLSRAMAMILTARTVSAAEGRDLGFVAEVVPAADLLARARVLAAAMCELSPLSLRASKQAVLKGLEEPSLRAAYEGQGTYTAVQALFRSEDLREGPLAFAQKRKPEWKGR